MNSTTSFWHRDSSAKDGSSVSPNTASQPGDVTILDSSTNTTSSDQDEDFLDHTNESAAHLLTVPIKWIGPWASLRPRHRSSLYYKVMLNPSSIEEVIGNLFSRFGENPKAVILCLLQFFTDLSGFQDVVVADAYDFININAKEVLKRMNVTDENENSMDSESEELQIHGKHLFMKITATTRIFEIILNKFVHTLVSIGYQKRVLFDELLVLHLTNFIKSMSLSKNKAARVTGTMLVLKLQTAYTKWYACYKKFLAQHKEALDDEEVKNMATAQNLIGLFCDIFDRNCRLGDKGWHVVRAKSAQEMIHWIIAFPNVFLNQHRSLDCLRAFVADPNCTVRLNAVITCEKLVSDPNLVAALTTNENIDECLKYVAARILDVSYNVAARAVGVFTKAIDLYYDRIKRTYKTSIFMRCYQKNSKLSQASGKFIITMLKHLHNDNSAKILIDIGKIAFLCQAYADNVPLLVEACVSGTNNSDIFTDWTTIFDTLLDENVSLTLRKHILALAKESVYAFLTGKFSKVRQITYKTRPVKPEDHDRVSRILYPRFRDLFKQFGEDNKCLEMLIDILVLVNYSYCREDSHNLWKIMDIVLLIFTRSSDQELLKKASALFQSLVDVGNHREEIRNGVHQFVNRLKQTYPISLLEDFQDIRSLEEVPSLAEKSLKTSILLSVIDMTDVITFNDVFKMWDKNTDALKHLVTCCKWLLLWQIKPVAKSARERYHVLHETARDSASSPPVETVLIHCKDFVFACVDLILKQDDKDLSIFVFMEMCDYYVSVGKELKKTRGLDHFLVKIDKKSQVDLVDFIVSSVFATYSTYTLQLRKNLLIAIIDLIFLEVIPIEFVPKILRHYSSDFEDFGEIMDDLFSKLDDFPPAISLMIMETIVEIYNEILTRHGVVEITSQRRDITELKNMMKCFCQRQLSKKHRSECKKLISIGWKFAMRKQENLPFLYFLVYAVGCVDVDTRTEMRDQLYPRIPAHLQTNKCVQVFFNSLSKK